MNREDLAIIIGVLALVFTGLSFLRDLFDIKLKWTTSSNFLKRTIANRFVLLLFAVVLFGFAYWLLSDKIQNLETVVARQEAEITSAFATQTAQAFQFVNAAVSEPEVIEVPVTVEVTKEVTIVVTQEVTAEPVIEVVTATPTPETPTPEPTPGPDIASTLEAAVEATIAAQPAPDIASTVEAAIAALPTSTSYPTYTPYPVPEPIVLIVTATFTPSLADLPSTPEDTVLEVGEWWKEDGVWLRLKDLEFASHNGVIHIFLELWNKTGETLIFEWTEGANFLLKDNTGHTYEASGNQDGDREIIRAEERTYDSVKSFL